jgi:hypothetical protein
MSAEDHVGTVADSFGRAMQIVDSQGQTYSSQIQRRPVAGKSELVRKI